MKSIRKFFQYVKSVSLLEWVSILFISSVLTGLFGGLFFKHPNVASTKEETVRQKEVEKRAAIAVTFNLLRITLDSAEHELTNNVQK